LRISCSKTAFSPNQMSMRASICGADSSFSSNQNDRMASMRIWSSSVIVASMLSLRSFTDMLPGYPGGIGGADPG